MFESAKSFFSKNYVFIAIIVILLTAAFLRLYKIEDYMTFLGDEGRDVTIVRGILHGDFTFLGPRASAGDFFLGPIYYYFMAPFLFISNYNPVGPAVMVALLGVATVFLVYRVGREFFGNSAGLVAAALYAVSPLVITYSRSSWNPNVMPFFSLLTLYTAYKAIENKKKYLFIISGIFLGILIQLHYLAIFVAAILFFYILFSEILDGEKKNILIALFKKYILTFTGFLIGISPFLLFELRHGFPNTKTIFQFIFFSGNVASSGKFTDVIGDVFFRMFGRLITFYPSPERFIFFSKPFLAVLFYLTLILAFVSLGLILYQLFLSIKKKNKDAHKYLLISFWIGLGVLFFGLYKKPVYDYYFGFMFPAPFLLVGNVFAFFSKNKFLKVAGVIIIALLIWYNLTGNPFRHLANRQYRQVEKISKFVLEKSGGKPFNFALLTLGNSDHAYRYIFEVNNRPPVVIQNPQADPERKSVTDQLFVVCEDQNCQPRGASLWEVAGFGRAEIEGEWPVSVVKVYKLVHFVDQ